MLVPLYQTSTPYSGNRRIRYGTQPKHLKVTRVILAFQVRMGKKVGKDLKDIRVKMELKDPRVQRVMTVPKAFRATLDQKGHREKKDPQVCQD
jgi:acyl-CoA thioesterase FadM